MKLGSIIHKINETRRVISDSWNGTGNVTILYQPSTGEFFWDEGTTHTLLAAEKKLVDIPPHYDPEDLEDAEVIGRLERSGWVRGSFIEDEERSYWSGQTMNVIRSAIKDILPHVNMHVAKWEIADASHKFHDLTDKQLKKFLNGVLEARVDEKFQDERITRAAQMGFDTSTVLYHGTTQGFDEFDLNKSRSFTGNNAIFLTSNPKMSEFFAGFRNEHQVLNGSNIMPCYVRLRNPLIIPPQVENPRGGIPNKESLINRAREEGRDGVIFRQVRDGIKSDGPIGDVYVVFDPKNVRSQFAKFAPGTQDGTKLSEAGGRNPDDDAEWWVERWVSGSINDPDWFDEGNRFKNIESAFTYLSKKFPVKKVPKSLFRAITVNPRLAKLYLDRQIIQPDKYPWQSFTISKKVAIDFSDFANRGPGRTLMVEIVPQAQDICLDIGAMIKHFKILSLEDWTHQKEYLVWVRTPRTASITELGIREAGFITAKGSRYTINGNTTIRDKAARPEHPGDSGLKAASARTVYVHPDFSREVGMWNTSSANHKRILIRGDQIILTSNVTGKQGRDKTYSNSSFIDEPRVGLSPLELTHPERDEYGGRGFQYRGNHPGNPITELTETFAYSERMFWVDPKNGDVRTDFSDHGEYAIEALGFGDLETRWQCYKGETSNFDSPEDAADWIEWEAQWSAEREAMGYSGDTTQYRDECITDALKAGWVRAEYEMGNVLDLEAQTVDLARKAAQLIVKPNTDSIILTVQNGQGGMIPAHRIEVFLKYGRILSETIIRDRSSDTTFVINPTRNEFRNLFPEGCAAVMDEIGNVGVGGSKTTPMDHDTVSQNTGVQPDYRLIMQPGEIYVELWTEEPDGITPENVEQWLETTPFNKARRNTIKTMVTTNPVLRSIYGDVKCEINVQSYSPSPAFRERGMLLQETENNS